MTEATDSGLILMLLFILVPVVVVGVVLVLGIFLTGKNNNGKEDR